MSTYGNKKTILTKNRRSFKYDIAKKAKQLEEKYSPLLDLKEDKDNTLDVDNFFNNIKKITNVIASNRYRIMDSEYKAIYYIQQKDKVVEKSIVEKELTSVEKFYKDMGKSLFKNIVTASIQTPEELQKNNIKQLENINYSMNKTKANMTFQTVEEAYDKALNSTIVAYDLETYGGLSSKTGIWHPKGITEFSFQELRVKDYINDYNANKNVDINDYIKKETAVIGITEKERDDLFNRIKGSLTSKGTIDDEDLKVTAKRLQMYGYAIFSNVDSQGITTIEKSPGDEVFKGGYDLEKIKEGLDKLVKVRNDALKYVDENGILPYHKKLFEQIATIQNNNKVALDFNGMMFDQPLLNGITNSILKNEYGNNEKALVNIREMFNDGLIVFNPKHRIDAMGILKEASAIAGTEKVYGMHANEILKDVSKGRMHRQEIFMEAINPELMKDMDRHKAEDDTTNVLRLAFEKLDSFLGKSPLQNALEIVKEEHQKNATNVEISQENMKNYIFKARGELSSPGRNVLDFTYDSATGTFRTKSKYIIGNGLDEAAQAHKGVINAGFTVGGTTQKGAHYKIDGLHEVTLTDEMLNSLIDIAPEYANRNLYVMKMSPYFANKNMIKTYSDFDNSIFRFFNTKDQLEAALSNDFENVGTDINGEIKLFNKNDYTLNVISDSEITPIEDIFEDRKNFSDREILEENIRMHYEKKIEDTGTRHLSTNLSKRTLDYSDLEAAIKARTKEEHINMNKHLLEAKRVSEAISRGEDMTSDKQFGIYQLVKEHLGFEDKIVGKQQLYSNTLNNYIRTSNKYEKLSPIINHLRKAFNESNREALEVKVQSALDYIVDEFFKDLHGEDYLTTLSKEVYMTNSEIASTYQIDVSNFQSDRKNTHKIVSNFSQPSDEGILNINLNTASPQSFAKKIRELAYGDNDKKMDEKALSTAMFNFVDFLTKNPNTNNEDFVRLKNDIVKNKKINSSYIAEKVLDILKQEKKYDKTKGVIRNTSGKINILDNQGYINKLVNYISTNKGEKLLKEAVEQVPATTVFKMGSKEHINNIVDEIFMPTINIGKEKYIGSKALEHILNTNPATMNSSIDSDLFVDHWNTIRKAHIENITLLSDLISNTGGNMLIVDGELYAKYGDEAIEFNNLARTTYKYGSLRHRVGNSEVNAKMDLKAIKSSRGIEIDFASNLELITKDIKKHQKKIKKASKKGDLTSEMINLFTGKISKEMIEESAIMSNNIHELASQNKIGIGKAIGKILPDLVGIEKDPILNGHEMFDAKAFEIIKEELLRLGENYKGELTPQMTEAFVKNAIPVLESLEGLSPKVRKYLPYISASTKDKYIGSKTEIDLHIGANRYTQSPSDMYDSAKRPTLQAGKIDHNKEDLENGLKEYLSYDKEKTGFVGSLFEYKNKSRVQEGIGIAKIESAITVKKANIGNAYLNVILENHINNVYENNTVESNVDRAKDFVSKVIQKVSTQEQEKIIDARLMDSVFEHSANVQHIRNKNINDYYRVAFDAEDFVSAIQSFDSLKEEEAELKEEAMRLKKENAPQEEITLRKKEIALRRQAIMRKKENVALKREMALKEYEIVDRIANNAIQISFEDGKFKVFTPEGEIVKRGDKLLSYYDKFSPGDKVSSKIHLGRFQHGVFEEKGNIRLTDDKIAEFLNKHLSPIKGESNEDLTRRGLNLLEKHFKVNYFVSDIRQNTYSKLMNDAVEKDMTYALYEGLGNLDKKIAKSIEQYKYQGKSMDILKNQTIKLSELKIILNDYKGIGEDVYKTKEDLMEAILKERYSLSDFLFREIDAFKDVSVIANHQTGKHQNYGMIADNVLGSVFNVFLKKEKDKTKAMESLKEALIKYDVFDKETMELKSDGTGIYIKPKKGKSSHSMYKFEGVNLLEDVRYLRLGGTDENGNEIGLKGLIKNEAESLYNTKVKYFNPETRKIDYMEAYGEIYYDTLSYINKDGKKIIEEDVALMSKGMSVLQQAIDPETMTTYDYKVIQGLSLKRDAQKIMLDLNFVEDQDRKYELLEKAKRKMLMAEDILSGYEEHSSPKKIGKQEFGIYNRTKWNYSVIQAIDNFTDDNDIRRDFIKTNMDHILKDEKLNPELEGKSPYREYVKSLIAKKIYDEKTDIELTDAYLTLDEYKHLGDTRKTIIKTLEDIGQEKVSIRYAEEVYQAKYAVYATEFNDGSNRLSIKQMNELGFKTVGIDEITSQGAAGDLDLDTIFNSNNLLFLGDDFNGGKFNNNAYIALPKAGKVLKDTDITKVFQSQFKSLESMLKEYNSGDFLKDSDYGENLKNRIIEMSDNIRESIQKYTYDKKGILHSLGTVYADEAFRLKFSFVNNTHNLKGLGDDELRTTLIEKDSHMLKRAMINGTSIAELEKNGIHTDYAFISQDVFERLGYFDKEKLKTLPGVIEGKYDWNDSRAIEEMKARLQRDGIMTNAGRYPMIMEDSEKITRVFLSDDVEGNRARVSVVTALSMNADNDGDSASFSVLKLKNGRDYFQYKIDQEMQVTDESHAFFKEMEARMAYNAISINQFYNKQSIDDLYSETSKAIENGTINDKFTSIKNKMLFNEVMYANNGQFPNTNIMKNNLSELDKYVEAARKINPSLKDMVAIDIDEINASVKNTMPLAEFYDAHINALKGLSINELKELGLGANAVEIFRENAIARTMWYESLAEAQSKARNGSIGPINVSLQGIRAGADALYLNNNDKNAFIKHSVVGQVAYELEQEVISAKHGSVVTNITKARDLRRLTDNYIKESTDENKQLLLDFFDGTGESKAKNLDDKTINKMWNKLESRGIVTTSDLGIDIEEVDKDYILKTKRAFFGNQYANVLAEIGKSNTAREAMAFNKIGGTGATHLDYKAPIDLNSAGDVAAAIINRKSYEKNKSKMTTSTDIAEDVMERVNFSDVLATNNTGEAIANVASSFKGKGLAIGALSIATGVLAAGFAGNAISQVGASELAKEEEVNNNPSGAAPMFLDQGADVTRSSSRGYIINMKATSNRDIRQTKKALRAAASESVGGAVNVNMTIRNREVSNEDIEQWITGL